MNKNLKRVAATVAVAGAMLIGAQGVAHAAVVPIHDIDLGGPCPLDELVAEVTVVIHHTRLGVDLQDVLGAVDDVDIDGIVDIVGDTGVGGGLPGR